MGGIYISGLRLGISIQLEDNRSLIPWVNYSRKDGPKCRRFTGLKPRPNPVIAPLYYPPNKSPWVPAVNVQSTFTPTKEQLSIFWQQPPSKRGRKVKGARGGFSMMNMLATYCKSQWMSSTHVSGRGRWEVGVAHLMLTSLGHLMAAFMRGFNNLMIKSASAMWTQLNWRKARRPWVDSNWWPI